LRIVAPLQVELGTERTLGVDATTLLLLGFPVWQRPWPRVRPKQEGTLKRTKLILGGRGVVIPCHVFQRIGLFDEEHLPHYLADHDFYLRCRRVGVPMYLASGVRLYVDGARSTEARNLERLSVRDFVATLHSWRSHRNLTHLAVLFRKHYPIPGLHWVGVSLNLARYLAIYVWRRSAYLLTRLTHRT